MDDTILRRAAGAAGYRLATDRLTEATIEQPEHVANWIAAAARHVATGRIQRLLNDAAQQLRDRLVGRPPTKFRADAEAHAAMCDLLAEDLRDRNGRGWPHQDGYNGSQHDRVSHVPWLLQVGCAAVQPTCTHVEKSTLLRIDNSAITRS
ncbi:hypothetical protein GCM10027290_30000 [Micromonospora sonneratiae]|uniref:DUF222 domain-containing protein n=1 Tax=Micromonospora sonneratiae TaxID=1184706 RepID=A0ABW3YFM8_9ACTN